MKRFLLCFSIAFQVHILQELRSFVQVDGELKSSLLQYKLYSRTFSIPAICFKFSVKCPHEMWAGHGKFSTHSKNYLQHSLYRVAVTLFLQGMNLGATGCSKGVVVLSVVPLPEKVLKKVVKHFSKRWNFFLKPFAYNYFHLPPE